jgi:hypothetical protein
MRFFLNKMVSLCDTNWGYFNKFSKFVKMARVQRVKGSIQASTSSDETFSVRIDTVVKNTKV